jgi:hypothetical protein
MSVLRRALAAVVLAGGCVSFAQALDFAAVAASSDARYAAHWVVQSGDSRGRPFVIVDKKDAKVFVFGADGRLAGTAPALLGMARGDDAVPGVGDLPPARIPPAHRTTPAGRFETEPGVNLDGEDVIWMDYHAGLAIHRVRPGPSQQARLQRLAAAASDAHRVSAGCVVVPVSFYENVLKPAFARADGVVYVLPETRPVQELFGQLSARL